jgi:hypothetical protein
VTEALILAATRINAKKVARRLERAGRPVTAVSLTAARIADLPVDTAEVAERLLGLPPRAGLTCAYDGAAGWAAVVEIARAVAAEVPLAVVDDLAGTTYLVHAERGLIPPDEYERQRGRPATSEVIRRMLGT